MTRTLTFSFLPLFCLVAELPASSLTTTGACPTTQVQGLQSQATSSSVTEQQVIEEFDNDMMLDRNRSAGNWTGGVGLFGPIGGDGRHGTYDETRIGVDISVTGSGVRTYQIHTNNTTIPAELSITGSPVLVTDGRFYFDEMVVPADVELLFVGTVPPQFHVRGRLQIDGKINISGESRPYFEFAALSNLTGDPGGAGGIFGGAGGQGGDRCFGSGAQPNMSGRDGGSCRVLANHAFAGQVSNTAGRGSTLFPPSGLNSAIQAGYPVGFTVSYNMQTAAGGGGGGLWLAGDDGRVVTNPVPDPITGVPPRASFMGPNAPGGAALPLLPIPAGSPSALHFLVGGSGGGGGASSAAFNINLALNTWAPGSGGGGGGGAIALRSGYLLRVSPAAEVLASGGAAGVSPPTPVTLARGAPGGGGSGGSVVLQTGDLVDILGLVDVRGGSRGVLARSSPPTADPRGGGFLRTEGGAGSPGVVRVEAPTAPTILPSVLPPTGPGNLGTLTDLDERTAFQSTFYATGQPAGPKYLRYELRAFLDGSAQATVFSDDLSVATPAVAGVAPIEIYFQGVEIDPATGTPNLPSLAPWRTQVGGFHGNPGLATDDLNGFRFQVVLDRSFGSLVEIDSVKVVYQTGPVAEVTATSLATTATPTAVADHAVAPLPTGGALLFGGDSANGPFFATYELHGTDWTKQFPNPQPGVRTGHGLILDEARQNNVLFGGSNPVGAVLGDTWTYASGQWSLLTPSTAPTARNEHAMAYDPTSDTGLLVGGEDAFGTALGDMWSWDGTDWAQLLPSTLPPARAGHALACDRLRNVLVLFGGTDGTTRLDDVWEWDGTDWAQITPAQPFGVPYGPSARDGHAMAYDSRSERVVVIGGEDAAGCTDDVWTWDGAGWTRHVPDSGGALPSARTGAQLWFDATADELRLHGGGCGTFSDELWQIELPVLWRSESYGAGCPGSNGTPQLDLAAGAEAIVGQTLAMEIANAATAFGFSWGVLGYNRESFQGQPIPVALASLGLPGCFSWTSADLSIALGTANAQGEISWDLPLPNDPLLIGFSLHLQAFCFEPPLSTPWAAVSNALAVRCGTQ